MDTLLCPPLCPFWHRMHGCGRDVASISTTHLTPSFYSLVHWAWNFLSPGDRAWLCQFSGSMLTRHRDTGTAPQCPLPTLQAYTHLHTVACSQSISYLCQPHFPATQLLANIPKKQAFDNAIALLCFDFVYTDFIHSMSCLYTYQGHNHDAVWDIIDSMAHIPQVPHWPPVNFDQTFWAMTLRVPLTGLLKSTMVHRGNKVDGLFGLNELNKTTSQTAGRGLK